MRSLPLLLIVATLLLTAPPLRAEEVEPVYDAAAVLARLQDRISADLERRIDLAASHRVDRTIEAALRHTGTSMHCLQTRARLTECRVIARGPEKL